MIKVKFEEDFPSLKRAVIKKIPRVNTIVQVPLEDIQKHCLDKQRVKEAIDKILSVECANNWKEMKHSGGLLRYSLFKELGLND